MKCLNLISSIILILMPLFLIAQASVDLSFFPYYNLEMMEDLGIDESQIEQFQKLDQKIATETSALNDALLYKDDHQAAVAALDKKRQAEALKILSIEQLENFQQHNEAVEEIAHQKQLARYRDTYKAAYKYLKVKDEQAQILAEYELGDRGPVDYTAGKAVLLKEILTPKQWKKYEKREREEQIAKTKQQTYKARPKRSSVTLPSDDYVQKEIDLLTDFYLPQRAAIRAKLEHLIDAQDQEDIEFLRNIYSGKIAIEKSIPLGSEKQKEQRLLELESYLNGYTVVMNSFRNNYYYKTVQEDRPTFERAKRLALKFDAAIDDLMPEFAALRTTLKQKQLELAVTEGQTRAIVIKSANKEKAAEKNYQTEKVEIYRDIQVLLMSGDVEHRSATVSSSFEAYGTAFPSPAAQEQTLEFTVQKAGNTTIELLDAQGKVIRTLFNQSLSAGNFKQVFALNGIESGVFFYRITNGDGTHVISAIKAK